MESSVVPAASREFPLAWEDIIVSKTDLKGRITYVNNVFLQTSKYAEDELIGQPHNIIRHPDMPRSVFRYLWQRLQAGEEVFGYVINLCKDGDYYWVYAHMTPSLNEDGEVIGYHSSRRAASAEAIKTISDLYAQIRAAEAQHARKADAIAAGESVLTEFLSKLGVTYDQYIWSLVDEGIGVAA